MSSTSFFPSPTLVDFLPPPRFPLVFFALPWSLLSFRGLGGVLLAGFGAFDLVFFSLRIYIQKRSEQKQVSVSASIVHRSVSSQNLTH